MNHQRQTTQLNSQHQFQCEMNQKREASLADHLYLSNFMEQWVVVGWFLHIQQLPRE